MKDMKQRIFVKGKEEVLLNLFEMNGKICYLRKTDDFGISKQEKSKRDFKDFKSGNGISQFQADVKFYRKNGFTEKKEFSVG